MYPVEVWLNQYLSEKKCLSTRAAEWLVCALLLYPNNFLLLLHCGPPQTAGEGQKKKKVCPLTILSMEKYLEETVCLLQLLDGLSGQWRAEGGCH